MNATLDRGHQALNAANVLTTKIGGINARHFQTNLERAQERHERGQAQIIVVSALREEKFNTTDKLIEMIQVIQAGNMFQAAAILKSIKDFHHKTIDEMVEESARPLLKGVLEGGFAGFSKLVESMGEPGALDRLQNLGIDWLYTSSSGSHHSVTGFGEDLARELYSAYFTHHGLKTTSLPSTENANEMYIEGPEKTYTEKRKSQQKLRDLYRRQVGTALEENPTLVDVEGGHDPFSFERGYSDATTAEMARAADVPSRKVVMNEEKTTTIMTGVNQPGAERVELMSRGTLAELTGSGSGAASKVVQSNVVGIIRGTEVDIVVHDPSAPEKGTTYIPWNAGLEVDNKEIVNKKPTKTVLHIKGDMENRRGVLAAITGALRKKNIGQTFTTRDTVTLTIDDKMSDSELHDLETHLHEILGVPFTAKPEPELGIVFCLAGSMREHPQDTGPTAVFASNRIAQPPFAATVVTGGEEGVPIPFTLTIEGPMSESPGVLAVITHVLKDEYSIDQTFSTESTWTITVDKKISDADLGRLYDALNSNFGNGWNFVPREDLRIVAQTENFTEHPLWILLESRGIHVHYMHAIPNRGVTVMMVPHAQLSEAERIVHNQFYAA